jgi:archaemetzincin
LLGILTVGITSACNNTDNGNYTRSQTPKTITVAPKSNTIFIFPFTGTDSLIVMQVKKGLQSYLNATIIISTGKPLPAFAFYKPRNRYIADSLLVFLTRVSPDKNEKIIGITPKDISTRKGDIENWGILGLGDCPGPSCVISSFRAGRQKVKPVVFAQRMIVLALHELGHTYGLQHCPDASCIMKDAEGKMNLDKGNSYCKKCRDFLFDRGIHR